MNEKERQAMLDEMKKDKEGQGGERKFWSPPSKEEGTFKVRFLPPLKKNGEVKFYFTHKVHWIDGTPYECLNQTLTDKNGKLHEAEDCPICKFCKKLYKTAVRGDDEFKLAGEISGKQRRVSRIVLRGSEDETKPDFYEYGPTIFNMLYHIMNETDFGIIVDAKIGRDFNLTKVGQGRRSKYETSTPAASITPIFSNAESIKKVFENATKMDYNSLIEFSTVENLKKVLNEYLGIESKKNEVEQEVVKAKVEKEVKEKSENVSVKNEEESEIDNILDEFSN